MADPIIYRPTGFALTDRRPYVMKAFFDWAQKPATGGTGPCPEGTSMSHSVDLLEDAVIAVGDTAPTKWGYATRGVLTDGQAAVVLGNTVGPLPLLLSYNLMSVMKDTVHGLVSHLDIPNSNVLGVVFYSGNSTDADFLTCLSNLAVGIGGSYSSRPQQVIGIPNTKLFVSINLNGNFGICSN